MKYIKFKKYIYNTHLFTFPFPVMEEKEKNIQYAFKKTHLTSEYLYVGVTIG